VVKEAVVFSRRAAVAELALIDDSIGIVVAPRGRLIVALTLTFGENRISGYTVIANPAVLCPVRSSHEPGAQRARGVARQIAASWPVQ
jgi:hypothetical protein